MTSNAMAFFSSGVEIPLLSFYSKSFELLLTPERLQTHGYDTGVLSSEVTIQSIISVTFLLQCFGLQYSKAQKYV